MPESSKRAAKMTAYVLGRLQDVNAAISEIKQEQAALIAQHQALDMERMSLHGELIGLEKMAQAFGLLAGPETSAEE